MVRHPDIMHAHCWCTKLCTWLHIGWKKKSSTKWHLNCFLYGFILKFLVVSFCGFVDGTPPSSPQLYVLVSPFLSPMCSCATFLSPLFLTHNYSPHHSLTHFLLPWRAQSLLIARLQCNVSYSLCLEFQLSNEDTRRNWHVAWTEKS